MAEGGSVPVEASLNSPTDLSERVPAPEQGKLEKESKRRQRELQKLILRMAAVSEKQLNRHSHTERFAGDKKAERREEIIQFLKRAGISAGVGAAVAFLLGTAAPVAGAGIAGGIIGSNIGRLLVDWRKNKSKIGDQTVVEREHALEDDVVKFNRQAVGKLQSAAKDCLSSVLNSGEAGPESLDAKKMRTAATRIKKEGLGQIDRSALFGFIDKLTEVQQQTSEAHIQSKSKELKGIRRKWGWSKFGASLAGGLLFGGAAAEGMTHFQHSDLMEKAQSVLSERGIEMHGGGLMHQPGVEGMTAENARIWNGIYEHLRGHEGHNVHLHEGEVVFDVKAPDLDSLADAVEEYPQLANNIATTQQAQELLGLSNMLGQGGMERLLRALADKVEQGQQAMHTMGGSMTKEAFLHRVAEVAETQVDGYTTEALVGVGAGIIANELVDNITTVRSPRDDLRIESGGLKELAEAASAYKGRTAEQTQDASVSSGGDSDGSGLLNHPGPPLPPTSPSGAGSASGADTGELISPATGVKPERKKKTDADNDGKEVSDNREDQRAAERERAAREWAEKNDYEFAGRLPDDRERFERYLWRWRPLDSRTGGGKILERLARGFYDYTQFNIAIEIKGKHYSLERHDYVGVGSWTRFRLVPLDSKEKSQSVSLKKLAALKPEFWFIKKEGLFSHSAPQESTEPPPEPPISDNPPLSGVPRPAVAEAYVEAPPPSSGSESPDESVSGSPVAAGPVAALSPAYSLLDSPPPSDERQPGELSPEEPASFERANAEEAAREEAKIAAIDRAKTAFPSGMYEAQEDLIAIIYHESFPARGKRGRIAKDARVEIKGDYAFYAPDRIATTAFPSEWTSIDDNQRHTDGLVYITFRSGELESARRQLKLVSTTEESPPPVLELSTAPPTAEPVLAPAPGQPLDPAAIDVLLGGAEASKAPAPADQQPQDSEQGQS